MIPTAAATDSMAPGAGSPIKALISPQNLFRKQTAALLAALKRARFNADGSIASGEAAIRRAAAAAAESAGKTYALTLYVKVPQKLAPDVGASLGRKVEALNVVLGNAYDRGPADKPKA